jgi:uncharacterized protein GlcG (DUF336 family)
MNLTLALATQIIQGAMAAARTDSVRPLSLVVAAPGGDVILLVREDGANPMTAQIAQGKAVTAGGFRSSTRSLNEIFGSNAAALTAISSSVSGAFAALGGGVPIFDPSGEFLGSAAAAGDAPQRDEACIVAGILAAGLSVCGPTGSIVRSPWPPETPDSPSTILSE